MPNPSCTISKRAGGCLVSSRIKTITVVFFYNQSDKATKVFHFEIFKKKHLTIGILQKNALILFLVCEFEK